MKIQSKFIIGCVFVLGIGLGMLFAAGTVFYFRYRATEASLPVVRSHEQIQQAVREDEEMMASVEKLLDIPEIREALLDPEIAKAIENKQYFTLLKNEKFRQVAQHPAMKEITARLMKEKLAEVLGSAPKPEPTDTPDESDSTEH